ncbi:MAG: insulinase family protein, partial [SAR202 cluster bacterium]|nr:insulinase family protein [SAR202 cluster bacterium]
RETIQSISRDMLIAYMDKQYRASNIVLSIAGNVKHEHVLKLAEKLMKGWPKGKSPAPRPFRDVQLVPQFKVEYRKTEQAHLSIGLPGLRMGHPDRYAFDLFSVALGEGMSSRLFLELRERLGLAYEVHSGSVHYRDCGAFFINAGVDPKKLADALAAVLDQVAEAKEGIPQEELDKARRLSSGRLMLRMEDTRAVSHWFGAQETLMDEIREAADIVKSLERVTTADLRRVSNDLLRPEQLNLAVVGRCRPSQRLEKALRF